MEYINVFLVYSIIGYLFELIVCLFAKTKPNSGILFGPWTPIYGIGVLIMLGIQKFLQRHKLKKAYEIILYALCIFFLLTILEQLGGVLLAKVFHKTLWDYSNLKFHLTKYIALEISLGWTIGAIIIAYLIHPLVKRLIKKIPFLFTALGLIAMSIDIIITIVSYI